MRICLAVHGFPPFERTGVENYTQCLAEALVREGHTVEVFAPRPAPNLPHLAARREERLGFGVTWLATNAAMTDPAESLDPPGLGRRFGDFLDRERPEVVHFQHLVKLGTSLVEEARSRGIPTVYTAHDYYAACHRYTLLRPDLSRCDVIGDAAACARCDLALGLLNREEGLGDYQMGAFADQLDGETASRLSALLAGDAGEAGITDEELGAAVERRSELDRMRLEAFCAVDLVVAPTLFLRERLIEAGLDADRIRHLPYGIDVEALEAVAADHPVAPDRSASLRIGYFGGLSKHKGVHVLLAAFGRLDLPAELVVHGYGTDRPYAERVERLASEVGAHFAGPYEPDELPGLLAQVDVVVVPSLWVENYPIVIREAFAAGRPVLASRVGALPESVRDGVDGLLFEPGDVAELSSTLARLVAEDGLVAELARGIEPVSAIEEQAAELAGWYAALAEACPRARETALPAALAPHVARYDELGALPTRELFRRAMAGAERLSRGLLGPRAASRGPELVARALSTGSRVQDLMRDRRREAEWVRRTLLAEEDAARALSEKLEWLEDVSRDRDATLSHISRSLEDATHAGESQREELKWLQRIATDREAAASSLAAERDAHVEAREALERERDWLADQVLERDKSIEALTEAKNTLEEERTWLKSSAAELEKGRDWLQGSSAELEKERDWLKGSAAKLEEERDWLKGVVTKLEEERDWLRKGAADQEHERDQLKKSIASLKESLHVTVDALRAAREAYPGETGGSLTRRLRFELFELLEALEARFETQAAKSVSPDLLGERAHDLAADLDLFENELMWRREEMQWFAGESSRFPLRVGLAVARLRQRIEGWLRDDGGPTT